MRRALNSVEGSGSSPRNTPPCSPRGPAFLQPRDQQRGDAVQRCCQVLAVRRASFAEIGGGRSTGPSCSACPARVAGPRVRVSLRGDLREVLELACRHRRRAARDPARGAGRLLRAADQLAGTCLPPPSPWRAPGRRASLGLRSIFAIASARGMHEILRRSPLLPHESCGQCAGRAVGTCARRSRCPCAPHRDRSREQEAGAGWRRPGQGQGKRFLCGWARPRRPAIPSAIGLGVERRVDSWTEGWSRCSAPSAGDSGSIRRCHPGRWAGSSPCRRHTMPVGAQSTRHRDADPVLCADLRDQLLRCAWSRSPGPGSGAVLRPLVGVRHGGHPDS